MLERRLNAWLRPLLTLVAAASLLSLGACGGGSGAPNNPYAPAPPALTPIVITPASGTAYAGVPYTVTISGGAPPYTAASNNPAILPVAQAVSGNSIVLLPNNVDSDTAVTITVRDSASQQNTSGINVRAALLLPSAVTITGSPACTTGGGQMCSGTTGTARVRVSGPGGAGLAGRQVRFDVVQGAYAILSNNPAQPQVQTLTVVTDQNGDAIAGLIVPQNTVSQLGVIRATEVTSGMQITGQFTIVQQITGTSIVSTIPSGTTTINGPYKGVCSTGARVTHYIFGGTPPYRVSVNFQDAVSLVGSPVNVQGGSFDVITNGTCFVGLTFAIVDANGFTVSAPPKVDNVEGTGDAPTTTVPNVAVSPTSQAPASCTSSGGLAFTITGGAPPYSVTSSNLTAIISPQPVTSSGGSFIVSGLLNGSGTTTLTIVDSSRPQKSTTATVSCPGGASQPLVVTGGDYQFAAPPNGPGFSACQGRTFNWTVTGGTSPYTIYPATPLPGGSTLTPTTIPSSGGGFSVTLPATEPTAPVIYQVAVRDASSPPQVLVRQIICGY